MALEGLKLSHYQLLSVIGSGGMGEVYLTEDTLLNRQVAIKVIRSEINSYPDTIAKREAARLFQREAKAIAMLDHPHILPLFDYGEELVNGALYAYLVMPFRKEGSLTNWLHRRNNTSLLSIGDITHFISQAASALQYAHNEQIIHQDVKPSNFLIRYSLGNPDRPDLMLTDFGVAKLSTATSSVSHSVRGTPTYMAPEQWSGNAVFATDQYALAVMAYELLTGRPPFQGSPMQMMYLHTQQLPQPPSSLNPQIPADMDSVLLCALAKQPDVRFASISAFANAFSQALQGIDPPTIMHTLHLPISNVVPVTPVINKVEALTPSHPDSFGYTVPASHPNPLKPPTPTPTHIPEFSQVQPLFQKRSFAGRYIIVPLTLIIFLVFGGIGYMLYANIKNQQPFNAGTTTTTGSVNSNATAQANATATAQANSVATAAANATATANATDPYPPFGGTLNLSDPLINNTQGNNWREYQDSLSACEFTEGSYHATETKNTYFADCFSIPDFGNFAVQVQMQIIQGDCGGIMFRADPTLTRFYYLRFCQDGSYTLYLYVDNLNADATILASGNSLAINTGLSALNTIAAIANGSQISLYANKTLIATASDSTYVDGHIGFAAQSEGNATEVAFSNMLVWVF